MGKYLSISIFHCKDGLPESKTLSRLKIKNFMQDKTRLALTIHHEMCHRQAAISSASYPASDARPFLSESAAPAAAGAPSSDKVYTGQVKLGVKPCGTMGVLEGYTFFATDPRRCRC